MKSQPHFDLHFWWISLDFNGIIFLQTDLQKSNKNYVNQFQANHKDLFYAIILWKQHICAYIAQLREQKKKHFKGKQHYIFGGVNAPLGVKWGLFTTRIFSGVGSLCTPVAPLARQFLTTMLKRDINVTFVKPTWWHQFFFRTQDIFFPLYWFSQESSVEFTTFHSTQFN